MDLGATGLVTPGRPGAGADVVLDNSTYHSPVDHYADRRAAQEEAADERARKQIMDSNGRALDFASKVDLLPNDKLEVQRLTDEFLDQQAQNLYDKKDVRKDPSAYLESQKGRQKIYDYISKAQQQRKIGDSTIAAIRKTPRLFPAGSLEKVQKWMDLPSEERGREPGVTQIKEADVYKPIRQYRPGVTAFKYETPNPDGTTSITSGTHINPKDANDQADMVLSMNDDPNVQLLKEYALHNVVEAAYPDWQQMPPQQVGQLINTAAKEMLISDWNAQAPKRSSVTSKKTPAPPQFGLGQNVKEGVVAKNVNIKVAYPVEGQKNPDGSQKVLVKDIIMPYHMAVPQTAKLKSGVAASTDMRDISTGTPLKNPSQYQFIPMDIVTRIKSNKVESVVLGTAVDKQAAFDKYGNPKSDITLTADTEVPLEFLKNVFKQAGVQYEWTAEAEKELRGRQNQKAATPAQATTGALKKGERKQFKQGMATFDGSKWVLDK